MAAAAQLSPLLTGKETTAVLRQAERSVCRKIQDDNLRPSVSAEAASPSACPSMGGVAQREPRPVERHKIGNRPAVELAAARDRERKDEQR